MGNKLKVEVKTHNFPHKMSIKYKILRFRRETLVKQDQLIFIYSKNGAKSMDLGELGIPYTKNKYIYIYKIVSCERAARAHASAPPTGSSWIHLCKFVEIEPVTSKFEGIEPT